MPENVKTSTSCGLLEHDHNEEMETRLQEAANRGFERWLRRMLNEAEVSLHPGSRRMQDARETRNV